MSSRAQQKRQRRIFNATKRPTVEKRCSRCKGQKAVLEKTGQYSCVKCGYIIPERLLAR